MYSKIYLANSAGLEELLWILVVPSFCGGLGMHVCPRTSLSSHPFPTSSSSEHFFFSPIVSFSLPSSPSFLYCQRCSFVVYFNKFIVIKISCSLFLIWNQLSSVFLNVCTCVLHTKPTNQTQLNCFLLLCGLPLIPYPPSSMVSSGSF